jgi:hypothetical protein
MGSTSSKFSDSHKRRTVEVLTNTGRNGYGQRRRDDPICMADPDQMAEQERVDRQKQAVIARRRAALADVVAGRPVETEEAAAEPSRMWDTGPIRELARNAAVRTVRSVRRRPADREPAGV